MTTPICDFINEYVNSDVTRMHMPGHKGVAFLGFEKFDITEIKGADSLYFAEGIIAESEANATKLFGSKRTIYSAEGSSQCIKAGLKLLADENRRRFPDGGRQVVIAARNAHVSFIYAAAILDLDVVWLWPETDDGICSCKISPSAVEEAIEDVKKRYNKLPVCVYITSPDYLGSVLDVSDFAALCHKMECFLFVDNAHGSYMRFLKWNCESIYRHPISLGADVCCDSAHKTLATVTGGAYLHLSDRIDDCMCESAKPAMAMMGSTSPSYLILASLDKNNEVLANGYQDILMEYVGKVYACKARLARLGFDVLESDPLKITIRATRIATNKLVQILSEYNIEYEYADMDYLVMMLTPFNGDEALVRIEEALAKCGIDEAEEEIEAEASEKILVRPLIKTSIREAMFSSARMLPIDQCEGLICADPLVSCPPAVPIVVSGEMIDAASIQRMKRYGIKAIRCL